MGAWKSGFIGRNGRESQNISRRLVRADTPEIRGNLVRIRDSGCPLADRPSLH
jgi:hypothetical protein